MFKPIRMLVTTDFSHESDTALREAVGIGEQFRSTVYLLHVIPSIEQCAVDYCLSEPELIAEKNKLCEEADVKMDEMIRRIAPDAVVQIVKEIRFGEAIDETLRFEREHSIDLVVAAPHRPKRRWFRDTHHFMKDLVDKSICETMVVR